MLSFPDFKYKQIILHTTQGSGEKLRFRADNIIIQNEEGEIILQHSCHKLFALFIIGNISLTNVAIKNAIRFSFPIILLSHNLKVQSRINCVAEGNTLLRARQYMAEESTFIIAKELIRQKINNQRFLLHSLRHVSREDKEIIQQLSCLNVHNAMNTQELMGIEGLASRLFFSHYFRPLKWNRREPRCKRDIPNLLLDIGYTYLFNFIEAHLCLYGFDLYCGVHHKFFYNRKSLVCDIVEPFRCIIDRRLRKAHNLKQINYEDFVFIHNGYQLNWAKQKKYTTLFMKDIVAEKEAIFRFCQQYYRWFIRNKDIADFPQFNLQ